MKATLTIAALCGLLCACFVGSKTDLTDTADAAFDAGIDSPPIVEVDAAVEEDTGPTYKPKGVHCKRDPNAPVPAPFLADGGIGDGGVYGETWDMPQAINSGGPVLKRPSFVPITFADEEMGIADELEDYVASIGCTPYWRAVVNDYGVGDGAMEKAVRVPDPAWNRIDDSALAKWLKGKLEAKDPDFPQPTDDSVYAIFLPYKTTVTLQGSSSCYEFGGYHNSVRLTNGQNVAYAVMPRCSDLRELTYVTSHELVEAAADPYPFAKTAHLRTDPAHLAWSLFAGGEVSDLCEFNPDALFQPQNFAWHVTTSWSNKEAMAGRDPCAPSTGPYFVGLPDQPDVIHLYGNGQAIRGTKMSNMQMRTIDVRLHTDNFSGTFNLSAQDSQQLRGQSARLSFAFNPASGKDGDIVKLTINKMSSSGSGIELFRIRTTNGTKTTFYWSATGTQ